MEWDGLLLKPLFTSSEEAAAYMGNELERCRPDGWRLVKADGQGLSWFLENESPAPGAWPEQDYEIRVTDNLDYVLFLHGNTDSGAYNIHEYLQKALVIKSSWLRHVDLGICIKHLLSTCEPNEWGYT